MKSKRWLAAGTASAAALAGTAAYVALAARRAEVKYPPRGHLIEVDQGRVHYLDHGEGSVVLLLHGKGSMATDFIGAGLIEGLARHHRVIAIDRPGFGYTERPRNRKWGASEQAALIAATLGRLGVQSATVVGHSWGVLPTIALALDSPHLVSRLVLVSGYYYPSFRPDAMLVVAHTLPVIGEVMRYTTAALTARLTLDKLTERSFSPQSVPPRFFAEVPKELVVRPSQLFAQAQEAAMMAIEAERLSASYHELTMPVTILAGGEDKVVSTDRQARKLHAHLSHSTLTVVEGVGHMLHHAAPQTVIAAIDAAHTLGH